MHSNQNEHNTVRPHNFNSVAIIKTILSLLTNIYSRLHIPSPILQNGKTVTYKQKKHQLFVQYQLKFSQFVECSFLYSS